MDDEVQIDTTVSAFKHTKWSFIVLAADLAANITRNVADTLEAATAALLQHRQYKMEEDKFFEIVWED
jgi:hypothetical protein